MWRWNQLVKSCSICLEYIWLVLFMFGCINVRLTNCLLFYHCLYPSVFFVCLSVIVSVCLLYLSVCRSLHGRLFTPFYVFIFFCLSIRLSAFVSICMFIGLCLIISVSIFVFLFVCVFICPTVCLSERPYTDIFIRTNISSIQKKQKSRVYKSKC